MSDLVDISKVIASMRRHVASYKQLTSHRSQCLDLCREIERLQSELDSIQKFAESLKDESGEKLLALAVEEQTLDVPLFLRNPPREKCSPCHGAGVIGTPGVRCTFCGGEGSVVVERQETHHWHKNAPVSERQTPSSPDDCAHEYIPSPRSPKATYCRHCGLMGPDRDSEGQDEGGIGLADAVAKYRRDQPDD